MTDHGLPSTVYGPPSPIHNPSVFAELLSTDWLAAAVLLSALSEEQRVWQAVAHMNWLADNGLRASLEDILDDWRILEGQRLAVARAWAIRDQGSGIRDQEDDTVTE